MSAEKQFRYPGIYSFSSDQNSVFFGRQADIRKLLTLIEVESEALLYAKSGIGKTSLLNAGVFPRLPEDYLPLMVRFYASTIGQKSPLETLLDLLKKHFTDANVGTHSLLDAIDPGNHQLWVFLKRLQLSSTNDRTLVLFFDQFEELFSYSEKEVGAFKNELYQATKVSIPADIMKQISVLRKEKRELFDVNTLKDLKREMPIKLVFSIRTDRLAFLDQMVDRFRNIRSNFLELQPLNETGARDSIVAPGQVDGAYFSKKFEYDVTAIDKILGFLSNERQKPIESTQLQIVCQQIEKNQVIKHGKNLITADDLPNFEDIFRNFYLDAIDNLEGQQKIKAEDLIENQLIRNEQRISLDEEVCRDESSENPLLQSSLDQLVDARLLRREPNSFGRSSYELAHDTLIPPILQIAEIKRLRANETLALEQAAKASKERKRRRILISATLITLFAVLLTGFALQQQYLAKEASYKAIQAQKEAEEERMKANRLASEAQSQAALAAQQQVQAEEERKRAEKQSDLARLKEKEALEFAEQAQIAEKRARDQAILAQEKTKQASASKLEAEKQTELATEESQKAKRLRMQAISKSVATHSLEETELETKLLLAKQALDFYQEFSGESNFLDPTVAKAIYLAYEAIPYRSLFSINEQFVRAMAFAPDDPKFLYVATGEGKILMCPPEGKCLEFLTLNQSSTDKGFTPFLNLTISPDGGTLIANTQSISYLMSPTGPENVVEYRVGNIQDPKVVFHPNSNSFLASADGSLYEYYFKSGQVNKLSEPGILRGLAISGNGTNLYANPASVSNSLMSVQYSPDDSLLAEGYDDGVLKVKRVGGGTLISTRIHESTIYALAFSPNGKYLATASWDRGIAIIDLHNLFTLTPIRLENFTSKNGAIIFTKDSRNLMVANNEGIRKIPLDPISLAEEFCAYIDHNLSDTQWTSNVGEDINYINTCEGKPKLVDQ